MAKSKMILFEKLKKSWEKLPKVTKHFYRLGPFTVCILSTHKSLSESLTRALFDQTEKVSRVDLTICLWGEAELPFLDWNLIYKNGYQGYQQHPFYFHYFQEIGALSAIDIEKSLAFYIVRKETNLPWWVRGSPLQVIFHAWLREKGMHLVHAASIVKENKALLLVGKGGAGKSTTVLSCLQEEFNTLGEDYIILSQDKAYSLYQTAKWTSQTRAFFPCYEPYITSKNKSSEKALVYYGDFFPQKLKLSAPICGMVSLSVGKTAKLEMSDFSTSLRSFLLTTIAQLPFPKPSSAKLLCSFARSLKHYHLSLGPDFKENVSLLRSLCS